MKSLLHLLAVVPLLFAAVALGGCDQEGPAERTGEQIDEGVGNVGEQVEEGGEATQDATRQ